MDEPEPFTFLVVWSEGLKEHVQARHLAPTLLVPVDVDGRYAPVAFRIEAVRRPIGWNGPCESWFAFDGDQLMEVRYREKESERPQPERWQQ